MLKYKTRRRKNYTRSYLGTEDLLQNNQKSNEKPESKVFLKNTVGN